MPPKPRARPMSAPCAPPDPLRACRVAGAGLPLSSDRSARWRRVEGAGGGAEHAVMAGRTAGDAARRWHSSRCSPSRRRGKWKPARGWRRDSWASVIFMMGVPARDRCRPQRRRSSRSSSIDVPAAHGRRRGRTRVRKTWETVHAATPACATRSAKWSRSRQGRGQHPRVLQEAQR